MTRTDFSAVEAMVAQVASARDHGVQHAPNAAALRVYETDEFAIIDGFKKLLILDAGCAQVAVAVKIILRFLEWLKEFCLQNKYFLNSCP